MDSISPEDKKKILSARARSLAQQPEKMQEDEHIEIVEFLLANEKYGIQSIHVREIYPLKELTPVPCTPRFVAGIINVRGKILSVIDLKKFFGLPEKGNEELNKVIIIHGDMMEFGILADGVLGTGQIPVREIQPSPPTFAGIHAQYLLGVTKEQLVVLDAQKILFDKKIVVHEEI